MQKLPRSALRAFVQINSDFSTAEIGSHGLTLASLGQSAVGFLHLMQVSTKRVALVELIPGAVPRLLRDPSVGLFRADERVFEVIAEGCVRDVMAAARTFLDVG